MKSHVLLLLMFCSGFRAHKAANEKPDGKLIGGLSTKPSKHPYLVSIQTRFFRIRAHICGGTLLSESWILSAGHCVTESFIVKWLPMDAVAGSNNAHEMHGLGFGPDAQIAPVDRRIAHPNYAGGIGPNDIAVLHTSNPFKFTKFIQPAMLPLISKATYESPLTLTGWGILKTTFFFPDLPRYLQEVNVTFIPYKECYEAIESIKDKGETNPLDEKSNICTGPLSGGVSACSGDSGGPLIQFINEYDNIINEDEDEDNLTAELNDNYLLKLPNRKGEKRKSKEETDTKISPMVVGVVSWGSTPCGDKGAPTVYTKVNNFLDFINTHVI
ncbi:lectizyme-like [Leguminivora glycinivorella]|uniref:lectizyme-like n=1 Tax=Leguminivora glycinivorella TaxID=1035111 RepID=UPI00200D14EE|nr:lectizyme-like [Leguminivora glycinivorella]